MSRTWNLRLNLDDFNALVASLYADADRALALQGVTLGANGGSHPENAPDAFIRGCDLGHKMYLEAVEFQEAQSRRGIVSAGKRREKYGTAQPAKFEPPFEPPFEPVLEPPPEPNDNRQSTNHNPQSPEREHPPKPPHENESNGSGRMSADDWTPLQEHRSLASVRNSDIDAQLARFRERNAGQLDTDQGWSVRFRQWLGSARPERSVSPNAVASPTMDEWIAFARTIQRTSEGIWPKDAAEAGWLENQAKGWKFVSDWKADCTARSKRWAANEKTISQRRRNA